MNEPPSYPEPVERFLWAALLVDHIVDIPCDFATGPSWPCHGSNEWRDVCPDLPVPYGPAELAAHSAEHGSASVSCRGAVAAIRALMVYGGGYVAACGEHDAWLEHHRWANR